MTSASRASPAFDRCDRPSSAPDRATGDQPGRLAHGPDEKQGLAGRWVGLIIPSLTAVALSGRKFGGADPRRCAGKGQCGGITTQRVANRDALGKISGCNGLKRL